MKINEFTDWMNGLMQCCPTRGPRACGPPGDFKWPARAS